jgi:hypothetical protein
MALVDRLRQAELLNALSADRHHRHPNRDS